MAPDNINLCYLSPTPFHTMRVTLMVSAQHYHQDTVAQMNALSVWKSADKRRRTENLHNTLFHPEVQELSWEIDSVDVGHAREIIENQQKTFLLDVDAYRRELKTDRDLDLADRLLSGNGIYPTLGQETMA